MPRFKRWTFVPTTSDALSTSISLDVIRPLLRSIVLAFFFASLSGCDPRTPSANVMEAVGRKHFDADEVQRLLDADPTAIDQTNEYDQRPLQIAALHGREQAVEILLEHGADVEATDENERTALHSACHAGELQAAKLLIAHDANVNVADKDKRTPLHDVVEWSPNEISLVQLLLDSGADASCQNVAYETPLDIAIRQESHYLSTELRNEGFRTEMIEHYRAVQKVLKEALPSDSLPQDDLPQEGETPEATPQKGI